MVAMLLVVIALFGYMALQLRLLHSATRLDWKEEAWLVLQRDYFLWVGECRIRDVKFEQARRTGSKTLRSGRTDWTVEIGVHPVPNVAAVSAVTASMSLGTEQGHQEYSYTTYSRRWLQNEWP